MSASAKAPARQSVLSSNDASADWARLDSNQGPRDYESPALTAELQARNKLLTAYLSFRSSNSAIVFSSSVAKTGFFKYASPQIASAARCSSSLA